METRSLLERAYRFLDKALFGAADAVLAASTDGDVFITFDQRPLDALEEAVRRRLGGQGETLCAQVWLRTRNGDRLIFSGNCALEHRSLTRSVSWIKAKVPALLAAADKRIRVDVTTKEFPSFRSERAKNRPSDLLGRLAKDIVAKLIFRDQWIIQIHARCADEDGIGVVLSTLVPPDDRFWADPFLVQKEGRYWLFVEELKFQDVDAHISVIELDYLGRQISQSSVVIKEPWHLSYPFIWEDEGRFLMMPEASADNSLRLYESTRFPFEWKLRTIILSGVRCADATIVRYCDRLWLFCASSLGVGSLYDELHIYSSALIDGPWVPHDLNPVKIDARSSRPAGAMWLDSSGCIIRPVQDCSTIYGGGVRLQKVTRLDQSWFEEVDLGPINTPSELSMSRFHTFNSAGQFQVIDLVRKLACGVVPARTQQP